MRDSRWRISLEAMKANESLDAGDLEKEEEETWWRMTWSNEGSIEAETRRADIYFEY